MCHLLQNITVVSIPFWQDSLSHQGFVLHEIQKCFNLKIAKSPPHQPMWCEHCSTFTLLAVLSKMICFLCNRRPWTPATMFSMPISDHISSDECQWLLAFRFQVPMDSKGISNWEGSSHCIYWVWHHQVVNPWLSLFPTTSLNTCEDGNRSTEKIVESTQNEWLSPILIMMMPKKLVRLIFSVDLRKLSAVSSFATYLMAQAKRLEKVGQPWAWIWTKGYCLHL